MYRPILTLQLSYTINKILELIHRKPCKNHMYKSLTLKFSSNVFVAMHCSDVGLSVSPAFWSRQGWTAIKLGTDIHDPPRMKPVDLCDALISLLAPLRGWHLWFWLKCLGRCWIDCHDWFRRELLIAGGDPCDFSSGQNSAFLLMTNYLQNLCLSCTLCNLWGLAFSSKPCCAHIQPVFLQLDK